MGGTVGIVRGRANVIVSRYESPMVGKCDGSHGRNRPWSGKFDGVTLGIAHGRLNVMGVMVGIAHGWVNVMGVTVGIARAG